MTTRSLGIKEFQGHLTCVLPSHNNVILSFGYYYNYIKILINMRCPINLH